MAFWLVISVYGVICAVMALAIWNAAKHASFVPLMRVVVFTGFVVLALSNFVQVVNFTTPGLLDGYGLGGHFGQFAALAGSFVALLTLIPAVGVLSGAAKRAERDHDASSVIPEVMHRVTNLEMIYKLLMDSSLGATFVLTRAQASSSEPNAMRLIAGNRDLRELLAISPADTKRGVSLGPRDPDGIAWWIQEIASKALASNVPVRSERAFLIKGQTRWYTLSAKGRGAYVAGVILETTQKRRESTERALSANTDPLTRLSNRGHLNSIVETEAHRASHGVSRGFVVYFFDFDGFKTINDTLGHHVGDELLKQIALRLRETFRGVDLPMNASRPCIARYGGDEYVVVVPGLTRRDEVEALAEAFLVQLREPYAIFGHDVTSTASIGGAICAGKTALGKDVLQAADKAMYRAKQSGKDRFCLYEGGYGTRQGAA